MAALELSDGFADDLEKIADHLLSHAALHVDDRLSGIFDAVQVLRDNPSIGRPTDDGKRELVIGRGSHGYVALYQYEAAVDTVFVLAIRAQREGDYARDE